MALVYRTISFEASTLLARVPPLYLVASLRKRVFIRVRDLKRKGNWSKEAEKDIRSVEELLFRRQWYIQLSGPSFPGVRTREAILPNLNDWIERKHDSVSFHLTQLLTGHGCFNSYLYKIGKTDSPICAHCGREHDTAEHTGVYDMVDGKKRAKERSGPRSFVGGSCWSHDCIRKDVGSYHLVRRNGDARKRGSGEGTTDGGPSRRPVLADYYRR